MLCWWAMTLEKLCYETRIQLQSGLVVGSGEGSALTGLRAVASVRYWPRTRCKSGSEGHRACLRLLGENEKETESWE